MRIRKQIEIKRNKLNDRQNKFRKCLAVRKISCNFATLLGADCRLGNVNCLTVSGVRGGLMRVKEQKKDIILIIKLNKRN